MNRRALRKIKWEAGKVKARFGDLFAPFVRNFVRTHVGHEPSNLRPYQVYPEGGNLNHRFFSEPGAQGKKIIDSSTTISSMGSCFAVEVRNHLRRGNFKFLDTSNLDESVDWGRVYTTKNMLQIFQYSLGGFSPEIRIVNTGKGFVDAYRESTSFPSEAEASEEIRKHTANSALALKSCEVLILTPGQNEAWVNHKDGHALFHQPSAETLAVYGEENFSVKQYSLDDNVQHLRDVLELFAANNPKAKVIFTVSPVPSYATFFDANVASRSFENKAIILLAVKQVVREYPEMTIYFPSFEMAMLSHNPSMLKDNRHLRLREVEKIMGQFDREFVINR